MRGKRITERRVESTSYSTLQTERHLLFSLCNSVRYQQMMERGSKRKAAATISTPTLDLRPPKRQKPPERSNATSGAETAERTARIGRQCLAQLRKTTDKHGRNIATAFSHLPDRELYSTYYDATVMPLALDTIEAKVENEEYQTLTNLESDIKRMVQNAKEYNMRGSEIFEDAERVRKATFNFMKIHNPAYKEGDYQAFPTPLPSEDPTDSLATKRKGPTINLGKRRREESRSPERAPKRSASAALKENRKSEAAESTKSNKAEVGDESEETFEGLDMQRAQRKLVMEMKTYRHPNYAEADVGRPTFIDFVNLPNRENRHYYSVIKQPACLSLVLKQVNGWQSREQQTGSTNFPRWESFVEAMAQVWNNAKTYNEDGSELYERAEVLEQHFKERLAEGKKHVPGPPPPIIKISNTAKSKGDNQKLSGLKVNLSSLKKDGSVPPKSNDTSTPADSTRPGQRESTTERSNAQPLVNGASRPQSARPVTAGSNIDKSEFRNGINATTAGSSSTVPAETASKMPNGIPQSATYSAPISHTSSQGFDSKWRPEGREPPLTALEVTTHPDLHVSRPLVVNITPHPKLTYQSMTANLPATHNVLRVRPALAPSLQGPMGRPYKAFLTVNGVRMQQRHEPPQLNGSTASKPTGPCFDVKLMPGMNRLEFECAAAGGNRGINGGRAEVELERMCFYVNLMRS